jgi:hypothetical protein
MLECSLEVYRARHGEDERYAAHLARRLVRSDDSREREIWLLVYNDMEPHTALFAGEERSLKRQRFPSREAAEAWAAKLLGIDPESWQAQEDDAPVVH